MTEKSISEGLAKSKDVGKDARAKESQAAAVKSETCSGSHSSPKKRRKVNHGKLPSSARHATGIPGSALLASIVAAREPTKRTRSDQEHSAADEEGSSNNELMNAQGMPQSVDVSDAAGQQIIPDSAIGIPSTSAQPVDIPTSAGLDTNNQQLMGYNDWIGGQNQFQDMQSLHPSYMFNAPEVTNEYNLLGDFLSNSLLDDGAIFQNQDMQGIYSESSLVNSMGSMANGLPPPAQLSPLAQSHTQGDSIQRSNPAVGNDKARETYYMTAADPSGSDPPEERMNKLLKAKYDAGLLKPFNYVKGYARLNQYMEKNMQPASRQKILRQLDKFRPKFRERMQSLTDIELILVEMWFERSLMEYDRVFASMAIPACCWRRTGEIFRGNNEMAQLIDVPIESLRDGKIAIHEIIVEDQLVSYWEKFGAIAFDNSQKAMLTSCTLKSPNGSALARKLQAFIFIDVPNTLLNNDVAASLDQQLENFPFMTTIVHSSLSELYKTGTGLWNACVQVMDIRVSRENQVLLSKDVSQMDLTLKILELAAQRLECLRALKYSLSQTRLSSLIAEYYVLRTHLAWLQKRQDIADHFFSHVPAAKFITNQAVVIGVCYDIGCNALSISRKDLAIEWLERAENYLQPLKDNQPDQAGKESFDLLVRHALVRAYLEFDNPLSNEKVEAHLTALKMRYANEAAVLFLELQILRSGAERSRTAFFETLDHIIDHLELTENILSLIIDYIKFSKCLSENRALEAFHKLLMHLPLNREEWIETSFSKFVSMAVDCHLPDEVSIAIIEEVSKEMSARRVEQLSSTTTQAVLAIIWKQIVGEFNKSNFLAAEKWCYLALSEFFGSCSDSNKLKVQKKLVICALASSNTASSRHVLTEMTILQDNDIVNHTNTDKETLYLTCRLLLQEGRVTELLEAFFRHNTPFVHPDIKKCIQLVCLEAQRLENIEPIFGFFEGILDQAFSDGTQWPPVPDSMDNIMCVHPSEVSGKVPGLILTDRLAIYILSDEVEKGNRSQRSLRMLAELFKSASTENDRDATELEWLCRKCYDLTYHFLESLIPSSELIETLEQILLQYHDCSESNKFFGRQLDYLVPYLKLAQLVSDTHVEEDFGRTAVFYSLTKRIRNSLSSMTLTDREENIKSTICVLEFKQSILEKDWNSFIQIIHDVTNYSPDFDSRYMEFILAMKMPKRNRVDAIRVIIYKIYNRGVAAVSPSLQRAFPRYLRVLFRICMSATKHDDLDNPQTRGHEGKGTYLNIAESILCQAIDAASDDAYIKADQRTEINSLANSKDGVSESHCEHPGYPKDELACLATMAFNQAMDFYSEERDEECERWGQKAIMLAELMGDAGLGCELWNLRGLFAL
ncbi:hypothetical protein N7495_000088 [Penicillium taxi]|uniref:uncharacterized protein n=1 Tax=Penicillium taxi TaxID=168475 RepID=UPI00254559F6|nr:uncharacterized protein N7495_000088 [Penicillium taxi]KAJ5907406.1 hypothetical protein N7495_000088 [Penicillium taxi]